MTYIVHFPNGMYMRGKSIATLLWIFGSPSNSGQKPTPNIESTISDRFVSVNY